MQRIDLVRHIVLAATVALVAMPSAAASERLTPKQQLGELLYSDINLSLNRNQSCETCHALEATVVPTEIAPDRFRMLPQPALVMVDASNVRDGTAVSNGSVPRAFGTLNAPMAAYAAFSPEFHWDPEEELFFGGQFWNGRAPSLSEQAKAPFLNPVEMAMPSEWSVIERLRESRTYQRLFRVVYGIRIDRLDASDPGVSLAYAKMAEAIAAFEGTRRFARFDSKFDFEAGGITAYDPDEQRGADLFDGRAKCGLCHVTEGIGGEGTPSLLTDFSYDNLGTPPNPQLPVPARDPGLQGNPHLDAARGEPSPASEVEGRHKVMSLRNIALTAPYMHNGVFKTLEEVVHFYNTRDVLPECESPADATHPGFAKTCWPRGEFHATRNVEELGDLGLSPEEEADLVAYLKTFTDNYPEWGNRFGRRDRHVPPGSRSPFARFPIPQP